MEITLLNNILIVLALTSVVLFICNRLRIPSIVGFLVTGIAAGPHGFGFIPMVREVEAVAEIGLILLLFTIGLEFSLRDLMRIRRCVLLGGSLQVVLSILFGFIAARLTGKPLNESIFFGFLVALSSTAIVLKALQDKGAVDTPHGRISLAILIFQDIVVVLMLLFTPVLLGKGQQASWVSLLVFLLKGGGIILFTILSATYVLPRVLFLIARTKSRELFFMSLFLICFGVAWITYDLGLSLALGAFLAGLILSESEYSQQALSSVIPLRDIFTSFFFITLGMLLDVQFVLHEPGRVAFLAVFILFFKAIIGLLVTVILGYPLRTALFVGLALSQVGEFSFVLAKTGAEGGLFGGKSYQLFLAFSVLTMAAAPFLIGVADRVWVFVSRLPLPAGLLSGSLYYREQNDDGKPVGLKDHMIIVGFGVNGRNVALSARKASIPYIVIEMNPETIRSERKKNEPIEYGDATHEAVLVHAGILRARIVVIVISDAVATRRIVAVARKTNPGVCIICRTHFVTEVEMLFKLGANEVIPEEFETSVEIFTRVLMKYLVPRAEIEQFISEIRAGGYQVFRSSSLESVSVSDLKFHGSDVEIQALRLTAASAFSGRRLADIGLRKRHGVTVLALRRGKTMLSNLDGDAELLPDDVLILLGPPKTIAEIAPMLDPKVA